MVKVNLISYLKKGWRIGIYPTADRNASLAGLILNAAPYFISKSGWEYVEFDGVFFIFRKKG